MSYSLEQGIIQRYITSTVCDVIQVPHGYLLTNVRLPVTINNQTKPQVGSFVWVAQDDNFKSYLLAVQRDPLSYLIGPETLRDTYAGEENVLQEGELFFESRGTDPTPGSGSTLYLSNGGTLTMHSASRAEYIVIGGEIDDDDQEIIINSTNCFIQSNPNELTKIQSIFSFDETNELRIANQVIVAQSPTTIAQATAELSFSALGDISLRNAALGVTKASLTFETTSGNIALTTVAPAGKLTLATLSGDISISSGVSNVSINNGTPATLGAARLNDLVTSNITTDPTYWQMIIALQAFMAAAASATIPEVSEIKAAATAFLAAATPFPTQTVSKITTASTTVGIG